MKSENGGSVRCASFAFFHDDKFLELGQASAVCLNKLDELGFEVHVFGKITADIFCPDMLLRLIADNTDGCIDDVCYVVLTDIPELFELFYKLYPNIVSVFCLFDRNAPAYVPTSEPIYRSLLDGTCEEVLRAENRATTSDQPCSPVQKLFSPGFLPDDFISAVETAYRKIAQKDKKQDAKLASVFHFEGYYYVFEPFCFSTHLTEESKERYSLSLSNTRLMFQYETDHLSNLMSFAKSIEKSPQVYEAFVGMVDAESQRVSEYIKHMPDTQRLGILRHIELLASSGQAQLRIYYLSMLIDFDKDLSAITVYLDAIYNTILYAAPDMFSADEKCTLFWQLLHYTFAHTGTGGTNSARYSRLLYRSVYKSWLDRFKSSMTFIPADERDKDFVLLAATQVTSLEHGPTKTVLDRARALQKIGKKVLVVNTKEVLSHTAHPPFIRSIYGSVMAELDGWDTYCFDGAEIPFMQLHGDMPSETGIKRLIDVVKERKPYFVFLVGGGSIAADLLSNMVPVIAQSLSPSSLCVTESQMQAISRKVSDSEIEFLNEFGFTKEHVVEAVFTSNFKPQTSHLTRAKLGLPDGKFILAVVGTRLDYEVTDEFIETLQKTATANTHTAFMGVFAKYSAICEENPAFAACSTFLGLQPDILAALEVCDLYVNPRRVGGGTSACESMFKGLPCVTLDFGDVAINTGPEFFCDSYNEMIEEIIKYASDTEYYKTMSEKAVARAAVIMDTDSNLSQLIRQVETNPAFQL